MTTCVIVAAVVRCLLAGPVLAPAEAAAVLAPRAYVAGWRPTLPPVAPLGAGLPPQPGVRDWPPQAPARRLDGTLWTEPGWRHVAPRPREVRIVR